MYQSVLNFQLCVNSPVLTFRLPSPSSNSHSHSESLKTLINVKIILTFASCANINTAKELFKTCDSPKLNLISSTEKQGWMSASKRYSRCENDSQTTVRHVSCDCVLNSHHVFPHRSTRKMPGSKPMKTGGHRGRRRQHQGNSGSELSLFGCSFSD